MECNRDEAERCLNMANEHLRAGNLIKARDLIMKAKKLYPTISIEQPMNDYTKLQKEAEEAKKNNKENQTKYSQEHLDAVKRVMNSKTLFEMLGITNDTKDTDIQKAFKRIALTLHPDKNQSPGAEMAFKTVGNAVKVLTNTETRKVYNVFLNVIKMNKFPGHDILQYPIQWWCSTSVNDIRKLENCICLGQNCKNKDCEEKRKSEQSEKEQEEEKLKRAEKARKRKIKKEARKMKREEEARKKEAEEEARKKEAEEETKKRHEEEEARKKQEKAKKEQEEEARKKKAEDEAKKKKAEDEAKKKREEEARKILKGEIRQKQKWFDNEIKKAKSEILSWTNKFEASSRKLEKQETQTKHFQEESGQRNVQLQSYKKRFAELVKNQTMDQNLIKSYDEKEKKNLAEIDDLQKLLEKEAEKRSEDEKLIKHLEEGAKKRKAQVDALKMLLDEEKERRCEEELRRKDLEEEAKQWAMERDLWRKICELEERKRLEQENATESQCQWLSTLLTVSTTVNVVGLLSVAYYCFPVVKLSVGAWVGL